MYVRLMIYPLLFATVLVGASASARVLHAAFENAEPVFERDEVQCGKVLGGGYFGYLGSVRICADVLIGGLGDEAGLVDGSIDEVILLTSRPLGLTLYRTGADRPAILTLADLSRQKGDPLVIRGQRRADGGYLVWFKGLDLINTICHPDRVHDVEDCRQGRVSVDADRPTKSWEGRWELTSLALVAEAELARALRRRSEDYADVTARGPRSYCVRLRQVSGLVLSDLGFEDCWLTAIEVVNSHNVALRSSRIHGSTFGMLTVATAGMEPSTHSFMLTGNHWIQSPAAYRPEPKPCRNPHLDLSCAVDVWDDLPWGVTHHHLWRPLNGALFAAYNIAGNVLFENNLLERAYNGIRMISKAPGTGRNVEIRGNRFRFLRDNAVEPENRADGWIVKQNIFENVHAWISTDGVEGGSLYVFGNLGWYDPARLPGRRCRKDVAWAKSPRFAGMAGDAGRYLLIDTSYDLSSVECLGHIRGTILKTGDKKRSGFPYFDRISIFNNSWRTRSPLFSSKHASPLSHFNNAVAFTGCGLDGPMSCRQIPAPVRYCVPGNKRTRGRAGMKQFWTSDGQALVADCFTVTPGPAEPDDRASETRDVAHRFCRDAYNRPFDGIPYGMGDCAPVIRPRLFAHAGGGDLSLTEPIPGCRPELVGAAVLADCGRKGPLVGALQPGNSLFDMEIPGAGFLSADFRP